MNTEVKINLNGVDDIKKFINVARSFESNIDVVAERAKFDGKSIMALFNLDLSQNIKAVLNSDDELEIERFAEKMEEFK